MGKILTISILVLLAVLCFISGWLAHYLIKPWITLIFIISILISSEIVYIILLKDDDKKNNKIDWLGNKLAALMTGGCGGFILSFLGYITQPTLSPIDFKVLINNIITVLGTIVIILLVIYLYFLFNYWVAKKVIKKGKV